jgi:NADH:ubiquinone oxidoreductase subunit 2 (subunit N)
MLAEIASLSPLPPLLAATLIACGIASGSIGGKLGERFTGLVALGSACLSLLLVLAAITAKSTGCLENPIVLGTWVKSGGYRVDIDFYLDWLSLALAGLSALMGVLVMRFSINSLHGEAGFHRFFLVLALFSGSMLLLITAGNSALCFVGWELSGVSYYLLIAHHYDRPDATANATRAFVTGRVGEAGFILGIVLAFLWAGGVGWPDITGQASRLGQWQSGVLACCFLLAAVAKSALAPLSPWLERAMAGPMPSSTIFSGAVTIPAGAYLVLRLQGLFEQAPLAMGLMALLGLLSALYGFLRWLAATDAGSALFFSATAQAGLMFFSAGLGFWRLALCLLCAHAAFRGYQFLAGHPSMQGITGCPRRPVGPGLGRSRFFQAAALHPPWLQNLGDRLVVQPVLGLAADLDYFDGEVVGPVFGLPAAMASLASPLTEAGTRRLEEDRFAEPDIFRVSGLPGLLVRNGANALFWFEERLVLKGMGQNMIALGRSMGVRLNHIEDMLNRPRYLTVFILATLLAVL